MSPRRPSLGPLLLSALFGVALFGQACHLVGGTNDLFIDDTVGTSGGGSDATSAGITTTSSASSTSGGAGGEAPTCVALECDGEDFYCRYRVCADGDICSFENATEGTACPASEGGNYCDKFGSCVECTQNFHCGIGTCQDGVCHDASCDDGEKNPNESDVDCGGTCGPCVNGKNCVDASDCLSLLCSNGSCAGCTVQNECPGGFYCQIDSAFCEQQKKVFDDCSNDYECISNNCFATNFCL